MTIKFVDDLKSGAHQLLTGVSNLWKATDIKEEQRIAAVMDIDMDWYCEFVALMNKVMGSQVFNVFEFPTPKTDDEYAHMTIGQLAYDLKQIDTYLGECKEVQKFLQAAYDHLSLNILPDRMDDEGVETMKVKDVGRLQVKGDMQCNIPADNREAVQQWLKDNGHESLISSSVNASTFKATIKDLIKNKKPYPKELIKIHNYSRASVVKG